MKAQSGYIAVLFAALLALGLALTVGTMVAQLKHAGALDRSMVVGDTGARQAELATMQKQLLTWYGNNAWVVDSQSGRPPLAGMLVQAGVQTAGAAVDVSDRVISNGIGYHVFAFWFPLAGATGTGLDEATGTFSPGILNGQPAPTPYVLVSGRALETLRVQQTRLTLYRIADMLTAYFEDRNEMDADRSDDINWFRDSACAGDGLALPCYGTDVTPASAVPIIQTVLPARIGLSAADLVTAWDPQGGISVNNYTVAASPPYSIMLSASLPWGSSLNVHAVSEF